MICSKELVNRIKRANGQMNGVIKMMESNNSCFEIMNQLKAIRASIDKAITILSVENLTNVLENKYNIDLKELENELSLITK